jgi:hypothetical protein
MSLNRGTYKALDNDRILDWADAGYAGEDMAGVLPVLADNMRRLRDNLAAWRAWAATAAPMRTDAELIAQYPATDFATWALIDARVMRDVYGALADCGAAPKGSARLKDESARVLAAYETDLHARWLALGVRVEETTDEGRWHLAFYPAV